MAVDLGRLIATDLIALNAAGTLTAGNLNSAASLAFTAGAALTVGNLIAAGDLSLDAGSILAGNLTAGGDLGLLASGLIDAGTLTGATVTGQAGGDMALGNVAATTTALLSAGRDLDAGNMTGASITASAGRDLILGDVTAATAASLTAVRNLDAGNVNGGSAAAQAGGDMFIGNVAATGAASLSAIGDLEAGNVTGASISAQAGGDLSVANVSAATTASLTAGGILDAGNLIGGSVSATAGGNLIAGDVTAATTALLTAGGSLAVDDVTALVSTSFTAGGIAQFFGDIAAPQITVTSGDIFISEFGSLGIRGVTNLLTLNAVSNSPIILGADGSTAPAYRLDEDGDIEAATVVINAVGVGTNPAPDVHIYDVEIDGTMADGGGVGRVEVNTGGSVIVNGLILFGEASATDVLALNAGGSIQVNTGGGGRIAMIDSSEKPAGILELTANDIWVGDQALLTNLAANPDFAGRAQALATNNGPANPEGNLIAGGIVLNPGDTLFVQNSGTAAQPAGITVGQGGLTIQPSGEQPITAIAYGQQFNADGTFTGGREFVPLIDFGTGGPGYTEASTFNGCAVAGCPPLPPPFSGTPTAGAESILGPIGVMESPMAQAPDEFADLFAAAAGAESEDDDENSEDESEASLAAALGLISTGGHTDEQLVDDPVTSGSDSGQWNGDVDLVPGE
jgi:hypothetical protein